MAVTKETLGGTANSTMRDIVNRALRQLGVVPFGEVATATQADQALDAARRVIDNLPLFRKGVWTDVVLDSADDYDANDGDRIALNGYAADITLPATYEDDNGDTRLQKDLSRVQVIGTGLYVFPSSLGAWMQADSLTLSSDFPFGPEDEVGFAAMLAVEMSDELACPVPEKAVLQAAEQVKSFRARFYREVNVSAPDGVLALSDIGFAGSI